MDILIDVSDKMVEDLFIGAFEGGSTYWAEVIDSSQDLYPESKLAPAEKWFKHIMEGGSMKVYDLDDEDELPQDRKPLGVITKESIVDALKLMHNDHQSHFMDFINETYDADTSDVFFQLAVMGEVIFG